MEHISTASKTVKRIKKAAGCKHEEVYVVAAFVDDHSEKAWLLQACEQCGMAFLLIGVYPLTIS